MSTNSCPSFLKISIFVALVSFCIFQFLPYKSHTTHKLPELFTVETLSLYNATDPDLPILLAILGSVFDVSKGKIHYSVGASYNGAAGRDASRSFSTGVFTGPDLTDNLNGLTSTDLHGVVRWRGDIQNKYKFVGKLVGRYYDSEGNSTKYLKGVEAKAARVAKLLKKQEKEEAKQTSCNSRTSQEDGSEVWCDEGYPRLVVRPYEKDMYGKISKRCVCLKEHELDQSGSEVYKGCDYLANRCHL